MDISPEDFAKGLEEGSILLKDGVAITFKGKNNGKAKENNR